MGRRDPRCSVDGCQFIAVKNATVCERHGGVIVKTAPGRVPRLCGVTTRTGGTCATAPAVGGTRCRMHGGGAPAVREKSQRVDAQAKIVGAADKYGRPRRITSVDAIVEELHRTQGHIDWLEAQINDGFTSGNLLAVYQAERAHLAKLCQQMAIQKVDERRELLNEETVDVLHAILSGAVRDLGYNSEDYEVRRVLALNVNRVVGSSQADAATAARTGHHATVDTEQEDEPVPVDF